MKPVKGLKQNKDGAAMIMALCIMALFMAVCLSLIYAAGQLEAAVTLERRQSYCYQKTLSYSEMLQEQLENKDGASSSFYTFVVGQFMDETKYPYISGDEEEPQASDTFTHDTGEGETTEITLTKIKTQEVVGDDAADRGKRWENNYISDSNLYVTVNISRGNDVSCSVKTKFDFQAEYKVYYVLRNQDGVLLEQTEDMVAATTNIEFAEAGVIDMADALSSNNENLYRGEYYVERIRSQEPVGDVYKLVAEGRERCDSYEEN